MILEFVQQQWPLFLALGIIVIMLIYSYVGDRLQGFRSVGVTEATRLINDGAKVLDVRSEAEYKTGRLVDAQHIPVSQLKSKLDSLPFNKKADALVVYCATGARSARACGMLAKAGYEKVYNLSGGISAWQSGGMPVVKGAKGGKKKKGKKS